MSPFWTGFILGFFLAPFVFSTTVFLAMLFYDDGMSTERGSHHANPHFGK